MLTRNKIISSVILLLGIIILINYLAGKFFFRLDFTADQRYTLSEATFDILEALEEPVTVSAFFSEGLNPEIERIRSDFKDMLTEYASRSDGMVVYEFINPAENEEKEREAQQAGISPLLVNIREKDEYKQQKAYLGALIQMGEQKEVIPVIQPGAAMEYALSSNIKKIAIVDKPTVGILQGHGEPSTRSFQQAMAVLPILNNVVPLTLNDTTPIGSHYKTVVILGPTDSIPPSHFRHLDAFIARGGRLFIGMNRVNANLGQGRGEVINTGLESWLQSKGIVVEDNFVIDANCGSVMVSQRQGFFNFQTPVQFPYLPNITNFADHPITKGLESVMLQFASSINVTIGDSAVKVTTLAKSGKQSGSEQAPVFFNVSKQWVKSDFTGQHLTVAAAIEGLGHSDAKIVIIGDSDFAINGEGQQAQQLQEDNVNFFVNAVDWLSDDTGLNELRTKGISSRPLEDLEDDERTMIKYLNFLLPLVLVVVYGGVRSQIRRRKQNKWRNESYV